MMDAFETIGLIGQLRNAREEESVKTLIALLQGRDSQLVLSREIANTLENCPWRVADRAEIGELCDLVIVVGGDGSMLGAGRDFAAHDVSEGVDHGHRIVGACRVEVDHAIFVFPAVAEMEYPL